ncbi:hypothetical protein [Plantactinospora sonchi]|uniref:Uncharacterized protein n=1 Tax=Plantactinospora sonchi TaxID=1544735 RepID=A0ABU7RQ22_9ACTN
MVEDGDEDALKPAELVPIEGGTWSGLLFDNPRIGLAPALTWSFRFPFQEVSRDYGDSPIFVDVDWLPLPGADWPAMAGHVVRDVGEFAESSVYFFQHRRYDTFDLEIVAQDGPRLHVRTTLSGDLDELGIDPVTADAWLDFTGIVVSLSDTTPDASALARLRAFTATDGLSYSPGHIESSYRFTPTG